MGLKNKGHRAGSLKQKNKGHKHGNHKSKRAIDSMNKGKTTAKQTIGKHKMELGRQERRHQATQVRMNKREQVNAVKKSLGYKNTAPFLTCIVALNRLIDSESALSILESYEGKTEMIKNGLITHIECNQLKQRFSFIPTSPTSHTELQILDLMKVCDSTLLLVSANTENELVDEYGKKLFAMMQAQGIPTPIVGLMDLQSVSPKKRNQTRTFIQKEVGKLFVGEKALQLDTKEDAFSIFRRISSQKRNTDQKLPRPHMLVEQSEYSDGMLKVSGYLRGSILSANKLIHITGLGDFQMSHIDAIKSPYGNDDAIKLGTLQKADPTLQEPLTIENVPNEMDMEPNMNDEMESFSKDEKKKTRFVKRIPKGMSEYQAAWIPDIDEVDEDSTANDDVDMDCVSNGNESEEHDFEEDEDESNQAHIEDDVYDKNMDLKEEKSSLEKIKAAQQEKHFPDEIDTPQNMPARLRFQKFRGLESFRTSPWDCKENLPSDYAYIFQFQNYDRTKKTVLNQVAKDDGVAPGQYVKIFVTGVNEQQYNNFHKLNKNFIVYGLLPHEQKMTVVNAVLRRAAGSEIPIKSKERLIVQCGYRRFIVNPIYSQHTNGNKHKYERFFCSEDTVVATFFAPIQFPPAPILCFLENPNSSLSLVATGRLLSCNPDRIILKRIVLSGHPFKIHQKTATIRYMFFNKEDVDFFKPCKLRTKCGRIGHIKESLGTHGHMKCVFDGPLKSFDTVFLHLYKRVFPKWTYENCVVNVVDTMES